MKKKMISFMTAVSCSAGMLLYLPPAMRTFAAEIVSNDFETTYGGWYESGDGVCLQSAAGLGTGGSKGMQVTGRRTPDEGAASDKHFYLSGGISYDYSVQVRSDAAETFRLKLCYTCGGAAQTVTLDTKTSKAGAWTALSAKYRAPENAENLTLTITTDSVNDFVFDDVTVTAKQHSCTAYAADASKGLKDEFAGYFRVGNTLNGTTVKNANITNLLLKEYNSVTCPNEMKPDYTLVQSTSKGDTVGVSLKSAAAIMDFCASHNIPMRGHTFVWHAQTPTWFFKKDYNANNGWVDESTMDIRLESYISGMFRLIKEQYPTLQIYAYDVANECIANTDKLFNVNGGAREAGDDKKESGKSAWVQIYKDNHFVEKAFRYARKYAPEGCALVYNDYNEYWDGKQNAMYNLCKSLYDKGLLDAVGMQSHCNAAATGFGGTDAYIKAMKRFLSIGCDVQVTELDINLKGNTYTQQEQANKYKAIFQTAKEWNDSHKDKNRVTAICMWGMNDSLSWIGSENKPLLHDANNQPKQAYQAVAGLIPEAQWGNAAAAVVPAAAEPDENGYYFRDTFESGTDGWDGRGSASAAKGSNAYQGSGALSVTGREKEWHGAQKALSSGIFESGKEYSFSADVYSETAQKVMLSLQYKDVNGETAYGHIAEAETEGGYVQLANANYKIPDGASSPVLYIETENGTGDLFIDEVIGAVAGTKIDGPKAAVFVLGDVNKNGAVDAADLSLAKALFISRETDAAKIKAADINCNKVLEKEDIEWFAKYLTGQTDKYPDKVAPAVPDEPEQPAESEYTPHTYTKNMTFFKAPDNYFKQQPANHGQVVKESYTGINGNKTMYVYVPFGYDQNKKYNVFYLMHGGGENENTCFNDNSINIDVMLDNMIASGKLEPMIVVTPTFNNCPSNDGNMGAGTVWNEMRQSIIPYVEKKYSTYAKSTSLDDLKASRFHRGYGGFSMGGGSTWNMMINNLDICAYYMPLSGHCWGGASAIQNAIDKGGWQKDDYYVFAATGTKDLAYNNMVPLINTLKGDTKHFTYSSDFSEGNFYFLEAPNETHWWGIVRHYIYDGLPNFFHEGK